jgi:hypothetical protein
MEIYYHVLIIYLLQMFQVSFCSENSSITLHSNFNPLSQSCTCSFIFSPPPCLITYNSSPAMILPREELPFNKSDGLNFNTSLQPADPFIFTNLFTPWEAITTQLLYRLTKVPQTREAKDAWDKLHVTIANRPLRKTNLKSFMPLEDFNVDLLTPLLPLLSKHQPSYNQLRSARWKNHSWQENGGRGKLPNPLDIYKRLETVAHLYNYAIFEPICSSYIYSADTQLIALCIEYWFTNWPYQPIPDYHCSTLSEKEFDG